MSIFRVESEPEIVHWGLNGQAVSLPEAAAMVKVY